MRTRLLVAVLSLLLCVSSKPLYSQTKDGDAVAILPGQKHKLWNIGQETLRLLCCCAPAYEHGDTIITEKA